MCFLFMFLYFYVLSVFVLLLFFVFFFSRITRLIVFLILITSVFAALSSVRGMSIRLLFYVIRFCFCCVDFFVGLTFLFALFFTTYVQLCDFYDYTCCSYCC